MHVVIIGNGISGITAARHIRKLSNHRITVISSEGKHFYSRTALMYIYMGHMKYEHTKPYEDWFWEKNKIDLVFDHVESVQTTSKTLQLSEGSPINYDKLIIATGSKSNKFGWPGQDLKGVQGLYNLQDLESMEQLSPKIKRAVIVGGGLIGIEMAEMFLTRNIAVTMLVREPSYWSNVLPKGESALVTRHIQSHHVDLKLSEELAEILPDKNGAVRAVTTKSGEEISCEFVGLTAGVSPNINFIKASDIETNRGVLVNHHLETNIPDVYAIGDCAEFREALPDRRPIEQVWYTGKMQGNTVAQNICGNKVKYQPGHWFNSAKFFDIEYQTYGMVMPNLREGETSFYWEHEDGEKCIHIVYQKDSLKFIGINTFGIRYRHDVFQQFLKEERDLKFILENLATANFDPEFYKEYETAIVAHFNSQHPTLKLNLKSKRGLKSVFAYLNK